MKDCFVNNSRDMPTVQVKSEPASISKDSEDLSFQPSTLSQPNLSKRPMSLDLINSSKKRLICASNLLIDDQQSKPLTTPDLEKIIHFLPTPQPGLLFQTKPSAVTSEQEAFGKGFEDALHSLHNNSNKNSKSNINDINIDCSHSDSVSVVVPTSSIANGMSGGSFTYTDLESFHSFPIKDEPQNRPISPSVSPIDMETQEKIKLERKRQRNRVAASKCRKRKLERISKLEEKVKTLKGENTDLGAIVKNLKEHVAQLKQQVIEHIESGCSIQTMCNGGILLQSK